MTTTTMMIFVGPKQIAHGSCLDVCPACAVCPIQNDAFVVFRLDIGCGCMVGMGAICMSTSVHVCVSGSVSDSVRGHSNKDCGCVSFGFC